MGNIQKILSKAEFKDSKIEYLEIELNKGGKDGLGMFHLQNDAIRLEMNADEFIEFSSAIIESANKLIQSKGINIE